MNYKNRDFILSLIDNNNIKKEKMKELLNELELLPSAKEWHGFIDKLLLWFGVISLVVAILFFMAYNWNEMGVFFKFALVETFLALFVGAYWYLGAESLSAKASLMGATILLGVLLALIGQTYQTGADPWQLFFYWAILMLPWAYIGQFSAIWVLWIVVVNISITLYTETFGRVFNIYYYSQYASLWLLFIFNTLALITWESLKKRVAWLNNHWSTRLLGMVVIFSITCLALIFIFERDTAFISLPLSALALSFVYWYYRVKTIDLFMLTLGGVSLITLVVSLIVTTVSWRGGDSVVFIILFLAILIIAYTTIFIKWLKSLQKEAEDAV